MQTVLIFYLCNLYVHKLSD